MTSRSHARARRLSLKHTDGDEDKAEDSSYSGSYVGSHLSPHQGKRAPVIQYIEETGTAVAECTHQNHEGQDLKPRTGGI